MGHLRGKTQLKTEDDRVRNATREADRRAISIALITGTYPILTTTFIDREIEALRRRGISIDILAMRRPDGEVPLSASQQKAAEQVTYLLPARPVHVLASSLIAFLRSPIRFWTTFAILVGGSHPNLKSRLKAILHFGEGLVASEILRKGRFDEIQAHFVDRAAAVALVVSRLLRKPYTLSVHAGADVFVEKVLLPEKLGHARKVVTCTDYNKVFLTDLVGSEIGSRIVSIPHGLDLSQYTAPASHDSGIPVVIAVGQLKERKGLMDLVEAAAILRDRGQNFRCHIVGAGPLEPALRSRIEALELGETVQLLGSLSHDDVIEEYRRASIFALPCVESSDGNRDGIPNVIPEAMAMGLPVVSTPVSGIPEVVDDGDTGLLVDPKSPASLADALGELMADDNRRREMGLAGQASIAEIFDLEKNIDRLVLELWPEGSIPAGKLKWTAIAWAPYSRRSEMFAEELGASLHCIHYLRFRSPRHAPVKYIMQALKTWAVLTRERPDAVHVQNPPFVCGAVVWLYTVLFGGTFVTEFHSAAFGSAWEWALPVQRFLARVAAVNIVTSTHWADLVEGWGGRTLEMHDPFLALGEGAPYEVEDGFNIGFISTFAPDEPVHAVVEAASRVPEVNVYITGDLSMKPADVDPVPPNVFFTGFLDLNTDYLGLLHAIDAAMVLTTRDHTLQLAACEAIGAGKPVITSDWDYLRDLFGGAALYVGSDVDSIEKGIRGMLADHLVLADHVEVVRGEGRALWNKRLSRLQEMVGAELGRSGKGRG